MKDAVQATDTEYNTEKRAHLVPASSFITASVARQRGVEQHKYHE